MDTAAAPIRPDERIVALDVIRGFALLGILVMNMPGFSASVFASWSGSQRWPAWWDELALHVRDVLFDGKFNSMFSMLFAIGFTIQLGRLETRQPDAARRIYVRRLCALLAFGLAHACLLWTGDVLHVYALLGFLLLAMYRLSDAVLVGVIVLTLAFPAANALLHHDTAAEIDAMLTGMQMQEAADDVALGTGSYPDAVAANARGLVFLYTSPLTRQALVGFYVMIITTMSLGLIVGRRRWFENAAAWRHRLPLLQWSGLFIGLCCGILFSTAATSVGLFERSALHVIVASSYVFARVSLMICYVTTLVRLALEPHWQRRLALLAIAGRMPLTNYLLQSLICTFLFYGWGLGLWESVGWAAQFVLAFAIFFFVQLPLSRWWLTRHAYGPMEYLWRVLTYGRLPR